MSVPFFVTFHISGFIAEYLAFYSTKVYKSILETVLFSHILKVMLPSSPFHFVSLVENTNFGGIIYVVQII